ncbi:MAG: phosphoribosylamine--glycine ligase, partial [Muribaculaceae bacterium]|nr:phosphoribosylamine--glycine ligase [Muribaculaceae bacterium]
MNQLNILLLGSGGRESALARKISESPRTAHLWIAPGNAGTARYGTTVPSLNPLDFKAVEEFVAQNSIDMLVVGNEDPLVAGIYDYFEASPLLVVGPS